jgi:hypothetical protein
MSPGHPGGHAHPGGEQNRREDAGIRELAIPYSRISASSPVGPCAQGATDRPVRQRAETEILNWLLPD